MMMGSNEYYRRKLEIEQEIQFQKRRGMVYPHMKHDAQIIIENLMDKLEELQYSRQRRGLDSY